jgi:energy-converting hydrogenase Eha subunit A
VFGLLVSGLMVAIAGAVAIIDAAIIASEDSRRCCYDVSTIFPIEMRHLTAKHEYDG